MAYTTQDYIDAIKQDKEQIRQNLNSKLGMDIPEGANFTDIANTTGTYVPVKEDLDEPVPDYIQDGLVAWFDISVPISEDEKWYSKVGDSYIYCLTNVTYLGKPDIYPKDNVGIINDSKKYFITSEDFYKTGYTIEMVGQHRGYNSQGYGGWFITGNCRQSAGIGFQSVSSPIKDTDSQLWFINQENAFPTGTDFKCPLKKDFGASVYFEDLTDTPRNSDQILYKVKGSVHGRPFIESTTRSKVQRTANDTKKQVLCVTNYYTGGYSSGAHIKCLRIYNRELSDEEVAYNHQLDVLRFKLEK